MLQQTQSEVVDFPELLPYKNNNQNNSSLNEDSFDEVELGDVLNDQREYTCQIEEC